MELKRELVNTTQFRLSKKAFDTSKTIFKKVSHPGLVEEIAMSSRRQKRTWLRLRGRTLPGASAPNRDQEV